MLKRCHSYIGHHQSSRGLLILRPLLPLLFFVAGCTSSSSLWRLDTLQGVTYPPLVTRLIYCDPAPSSPLTFEILHGKWGAESYLSLTRHKFHPSCQENGTSIKTKLTTPEGNYEEFSPLFQGGMKVRLSGEMTHRIIDSLKKGAPVILEVDGFEKRLESGPFSTLFTQWEKGGGFLKNLFKGPVE